MVKYFVTVLIAAAIFGTGMYVGYKMHPALPPPPVVDVTAVVNEIKRVSLCANMRGSYTEFIEYTVDPTSYVFYKKLYAKAHASALAGFDLKNMQIDVNTATKVITATISSPAEILSLDTDVTILYQKEGIFTDIESPDYNALKDSARVQMRKIVESSAILAESREHAGEIFHTMEFIANSNGFEFKLVLPDQVKQ